MPARAISSGTISFGLVSIPIKVYTATSSQTLRFNMLDAQHRQRLKQQYVSSRSGEVVERSQTVRGYEYAKDQYVVLTDEELKALETRSDGTIAICEFVPIEKVDPIYFERSQLLRRLGRSRHGPRQRGGIEGETKRRPACASVGARKPVGDVEQLAHRGERVRHRHGTMAVHGAVAECVDHTRLAEHRLTGRLLEARLVD